jgi:hypothetical protein
VVAQTSITISSTEVGTISADPDRVVSAGGALNPTLVVPLEVALERHTDGEPTLGLNWLEARLGLPGGSPGAWPMIGPTSFRFTGALGHATIHSLPVVSRRELPIDFALTEGQVRALEDLAHVSRGDSVPITLSFSGLLCQVVEGSPVTLRQGRGTSAARHQVGNLYDLRPIAETRIGELTIPIARERWAKEIIPGFGVDRLRMVAVRFPSGGSTTAPIVQRFDEAVREYDAGRYEQALGKLRKLREAVEKSFGAVGSRPLADIMAERRGWTQSQVASFDRVWKALIDITNESVHGDEHPPRVYDHSEARLAIMVAAAALECLSAIIGAQ